MDKLVVLIIVSAVVCSISAQLTYECHPNDTIIVTNPMPSHYIGAFANNSQGQCNTTYSVDYSILTVTGCGKDEDILLQLTNRSASDTILGGSGIYLTTVRCNEIGSTGVDRELTQPFFPTLELTTQNPILPTFTVASELRSGGTVGAGYSDGTIVNTVTVGEELHWLVEIPDVYYAKMLQCTAYSGSSSTGTPNSQLILDGCSQDTALVDSFYTSNSVVVGLYRYYYTELHAFKFYNSDGLYLFCDVKLCPASGSSNCLVDSCTKRRRRDSNEDNSHSFIAHTGTGVKVFLPPSDSKASTTLGFELMTLIFPLLVTMVP